MEPLCKLGLSRMGSQRSFDNFQRTADKNLEKIWLERRQNSASIDIKFASFDGVLSSKGGKTFPSIVKQSLFNSERYG